MYRPRWVAYVAIVLALPACSLPGLLEACPADMPALKAIIWCYPFYMLLSAWLAWQAYPQRPVVSWILMIMMVLTTSALFAMMHNL